MPDLVFEEIVAALAGEMDKRHELEFALRDAKNRERAIWQGLEYIIDDHRITTLRPRIEALKEDPVAAANSRLPEGRKILPAGICYVCSGTCITPDHQVCLACDQGWRRNRA